MFGGRSCCHHGAPLACGPARQRKEREYPLFGAQDRRTAGRLLADALSLPTAGCRRGGGAPILTADILDAAAASSRMQMLPPLRVGEGAAWHGCHRTPDTPSPTHLARPARSPLTMRVPRRRRTQLALTSAHSPPPRSLDGETHARRAPARGRRTRPATPPRRVCARYQRAQQPHRRQAPVLIVLV